MPMLYYIPYVLLLAGSSREELVHDVGFNSNSPVRIETPCPRSWISTTSCPELSAVMGKISQVRLMNFIIFHKF